MLFGPNIKYFNELEINGEHVDDGDNEDFTKNQQENPDEDNDDVAETDAGDDLADYTEEEFDAEEDGEPADDAEEPTEETEGDEPADDTETATDDGDDDLTDYTEEDDEPAADEGDDAEGGEATDGEDDLTDYTDDDFDAEGGEATDDGTDDTGSEDSDEGDDAGNDDEGGDSENSDSADNQNGNTLADMEKNLFSDLSPQQLAIKNNELLQNYIQLYETIVTIFDSINKIPKTYDNTRPLTFIADQLVELKDMVNYVITTTYVTRTYVENMTYYKQALVVLEQLNTMLKALIQKPSK